MEVQQFLVYIILGFAFVNNKVIICWGGVNITQNQKFTLKFPISFTNTTYCINFSAVQESYNPEWFNTYSRTTSNTGICSYALGGQKYWCCIGY